MAKITKEEIQGLILSAAVEGNILAITSRCDAACIFCSHLNNPPEVRVASVGERSYGDILATMDHLSGDSPIYIGESASCVIEGEPMLHPRFDDILRELRRRFKHTPIAVTTNGHHLTRARVELLRDLMPITLCISINSSTVAGRKALMGDSEKQTGAVTGGIMLLGELFVPYHASLVAMPNLVGYDDIEATIRFLSDNNATSVHIFMPGFSDRADPEMFPDPETIHPELRAFIDRIADGVACPLLLEPSLVSDLIPSVSGVLRPLRRALLRA